jgi:hypothetical protein
MTALVELQFHLVLQLELSKQLNYAMAMSAT